MKSWWRRFIPPVVVGGLLLVLWQALHLGLDPDSRFLLPSPSQVGEALQENASLLVRAARNTATGALLGLFAAVIVSIVLAAGMTLSSWMRAGLYPYLLVLQMMPVIVIAPMLVVWVGPGIKSVSIITLLICFFPLVVNTTQGLLSTDRYLVELFQMWRTSRWRQLVYLRAPAALPYFFTGLRIAAVLAPIGALVGDYTAGSSAGDGGGLGFQTIVFSSQAKYSALLATALVTCCLGFVFTAAVSALSWLCLRQWHDSYDRSDR